LALLKLRTSASTSWSQRPGTKSAVAAAKIKSGTVMRLHELTFNWTAFRERRGAPVLCSWSSSSFAVQYPQLKGKMNQAVD
jgi:hypothetical protein